MKEQLVKLKTAKLAKEKGFKWTVYNSFEDRKSFKEPDGMKNDDTKLFHNTYARPTLTILQKWFRDVHNLYVLVENNDLEYEDIWYFYVNKKGGENLLVNSIKFQSYEQALEAGLQETLKIYLK